MHRAAHRERVDMLQSLRDRDLFGARRTRTRADAQRSLQLRSQMRELAARQRRLERGGAMPFRFAVQFADVAAAGGFSLVIGNPPWVRPHALSQTERLQVRAEFRTMRHAAWKTGALRAGAGVGFAAQADLAVAFVERSVQLLKPDGIMSLLVPAKLWRALAGGGLRAFLRQQTTVLTVRDWSDAPALFDAAVYPSLLVAQRNNAVDNDVIDLAAAVERVGPESNSRGSGAVHLATTAECHAPIHVTVARRHNTARFVVRPDALSLNGDVAAPWLLMPESARSAFQRVHDAGPALGDSSLGRPLLGVKCGCNAAFLVAAHEHDDDTAQIESEQRIGIIERRMLRPVMRGETLHDAHATRRVRTPGKPGTDARIVWTHDSDDRPYRRLPPHASRWLSHWRSRLERRTDGNASTPWWSLFRTASAQCGSPRVVWADIGKTLRAVVLDAGDPTVALNSCYVLRTSCDDDARALHTLLTSPVAGAWFEALAEPARGGFRRYLGWTVATMPIPQHWLSARHTLAEYWKEHADGTARDPFEHSAVVADAFGIPLRHLEPLLRWYRL